MAAIRAATWQVLAIPGLKNLQSQDPIFRIRLKDGLLFYYPSLIDLRPILHIECSRPLQKVYIRHSISKNTILINFL